MRYIGTHMHLHSCYEVLGSMHGHCAQAKKYGLEALWFTDHDTFMGARRACNGYDFESGLLHSTPNKGVAEKLRKWTKLMAELGENIDQDLWRRALEKATPLPSYTGFITNQEECVTWDDSDAFTGTHCMCMEVAGQTSVWKTVSAEFVAWKKRMNRPLIAGVTLGLAFRLDQPLGNNGRVLIEFAFSHQPPNWDVSKLIYCAGLAEGLEAPGTVVLPFELEGNGIWQYVFLPLSADAEYHVPGQLDNAFQNMTIRIEARNGKQFALRVDQLCIWETYHLQELMLRQRSIGRKIGREYGVNVFVTTEVSMAGHHKNCFSEHVPIMDYPAAEYHITHEEAVVHLHKHNAVFAFNHPYIEYIHLPLTQVQREKVVRHETQVLIRERCYGAPLLEVAFPEGRYGFELSDYLKLWDDLSLHGVYVTGYGDSDNHRCDERWADGNNFAAYIAAEEADCDSLCKGMCAGDLYSADPAESVRLESFTLAEHPDVHMGSIVLTQPGQVDVRIRLTGCTDDMELRWIDHGNVSQIEHLATGKAVYTHGCMFGGERGLCRVEVYRRSDNRCLLISNPIYFAVNEPQAHPQRPIVWLSNGQ